MFNTLSPITVYSGYHCISIPLLMSEGLHKTSNTKSLVQDKCYQRRNLETQ